MIVVVQDRLYPLVQLALAMLRREGLIATTFDASGDDSGAWIVPIVESGRTCAIFCEKPELIACLANRQRARAASVTTLAQAERAVTTLGANLLTIEMPGRTFYEIKAMIRLLAQPRSCPEEVKEILDYANR
jgi:hypothetical protein